MTEHTPGPWRENEGGDSICVLAGSVDDPEVISITDLGDVMAVCNRPDGSGADEARANNRLIAKSPELLAMLRVVAARIDRASGSPRFTSEEHDKMAALIAAASGDAQL